jgi:rhodanese-related sulfurtransferase
MYPRVPSVAAQDVPEDAVTIDAREDDEVAGHIHDGIGAWAAAGRPLVSETGGVPVVR